MFWKEEHSIVETKYSFQPIQAVNKLTQSYVVSSALYGVNVEKHDDNLIIRLKVAEITDDLRNYRDNSGYFYEYDCKDLSELRQLFDDKRCQTVGYIGSRDAICELISSGVRGVDRVVSVGKTMDFDLGWI